MFDWMRWEARGVSSRSLKAPVIAFLGALLIPSFGALAEEGNTASTGEMIQTARVDTIGKGSSETKIDLGEAGEDLGFETSPGLDLSLPLISVVREADPPSARALRIASCYEASLGRYHSEKNRAFSEASSRPGSFDLTLADYYARKVSRTQFADCSSF